MLTMRIIFGWIFFVIFVLWALNGASSVLIGLSGGSTFYGRSQTQTLISGVVQLGLAYLILRLSRRLRGIK